MCVCENVITTDYAHMIKFFDGISPRPVMSFIHPISNCHHFVATVIKYRPAILPFKPLHIHIGHCHGYRSIIVLLRRAGRRSMPSIVLSEGTGILAKLRAVVNQSIKLPN